MLIELRQLENGEFLTGMLPEEFFGDGGPGHSITLFLHALMLRFTVSRESPQQSSPLLTSETPMYKAYGFPLCR